MYNKRFLLYIFSMMVLNSPVLMVAMEIKPFSRDTVRLANLCSCKDSSAEEARVLINKGADIHYKGLMGCSLLHSAATVGNVELINFFDISGFDLSLKDDLGRTPLLLASGQCHKESIEYIVRRGCLFDVDNNGNAALHYAASNFSSSSKEDVINFLLHRTGFLNIDQKNISGHTPLIVACSEGRWDNAKILIEQGADVNVYGRNNFTPLLYAMQDGDLDHVKFLLQKGARVDVKDSVGNSLLHCALRVELEIIECLLAAGVPLNDKNDKGLTLLFCAIQNDDLDCVKFLLQKGACVDVKDRLGNSVLHYAIKAKPEILECLLAAGAPLNDKSSFGWTPLFSACNDKKYESAKILIAQGADVNAGSLITNQRQRDFTLWESLIKQKVVDGKKKTDFTVCYAPDYRYQEFTALHLASLDGQCDIVALLIAEGADVNAKTENGGTPLCVAAARGHYDIMKILLKAGADISLCATGYLVTEDNKYNEGLGQSWGRVTALDIAPDKAKVISIIELITKPIMAVKNAVIKKVQSNKQVQPNKVVQLNKIVGQNKVQIIKPQKSLNVPVVRPLLLVQSPSCVTSSFQLLNCTSKTISDICVCFDDHVDRVARGGKSIKFFVFKNHRNGATPGTYCLDSFNNWLPVPKQLDNVGSQLADNHLSTLRYSKPAQQKMANMSDSWHSFPQLIEQQVGHWGHAKVCDFNNTPKQKIYWQKQLGASEKIDDYWYELRITIPAKKESSTCSDRRALQTGSVGVFEFIVLKKNLSDDSGFCVHRLYKE